MQKRLDLGVVQNMSFPEVLGSLGTPRAEMINSVGPIVENRPGGVALNIEILRQVLVLVIGEQMMPSVLTLTVQ